MPCPFSKKKSTVITADPKHILVCRPDNIGDLIVTLPMIKVIKQQWPECKVTVFVRQYTEDIVAMCPDIDGFISWDEISKLPNKQAIESIKQLNCDIAIHATPYNIKMAKIIYKSGIKVRIGRGNRFSKLIYFSHRIKKGYLEKQHEATYTIKLLEPLGVDTQISTAQAEKLISFQAPPITNKIKNIIDPNRFSIILHPLSNSHAREWPIEYYKELAQELDPKKYQVFITGSIQENEKIKNTSLAKVESIENICGQISLKELVILIKNVDGIIVGSTGPLHLAAATGTSALGLYPKQADMDPDRWGPLGENAIALTCDMPCPGCTSDADCACMRAIKVMQIKKIIESWVINKTSPPAKTN